jgi:uncharacterized spore protein YtfJ
MSEEPEFEADETQPEAEEVETYGDISESAIDAIENITDTFLSRADVSAVYGEPIDHGEVRIIPAAEVIAGFGYGLGGGGGSGPQEKDSNKGSGSGMGGGGGGRAFARPVAVIISGPDGVRVEPVIDPTKIVLAFVTAVGFMAATLMRMTRRPRKF